MWDSIKGLIYCAGGSRITGITVPLIKVFFVWDGIKGLISCAGGGRHQVRRELPEAAPRHPAQPRQHPLQLYQEQGQHF